MALNGKAAAAPMAGGTGLASVSGAPMQRTMSYGGKAGPAAGQQAQQPSGIAALPPPAQATPENGTSGPWKRDPSTDLNGDRHVITPGYEYANSADRLRQKYGNNDPIAAFPSIRVPGVDLNRADFDYTGDRQSTWNARAREFLGAAGPTMNRQAFDNAAQTRGLMLDAAQGNGPSAAGAQFQQNLDNSVAAQMAAANSMRGGAAARASAQRQAALGGQQMQLQGANQSAMLRAQEMQAARQGLLSADQGFGNLSAADLNAALAARGQNYGLGQAMYGMGMGAAGADNAARQAYANGQANYDFNTQTANANLQAGHDAQSQNFLTQMTGAGMSGAGAMLGLALMSDAKAKEEVRDAGDDVDELLSKLKAKSYRYKAEVSGLAGVSKGPQTGIMAQDLASSKAGKSLVSKAEDGYLRVDVGKAALAGLAAAARLNERLERLEKGKR